MRVRTAVMALGGSAILVLAGLMLLGDRTPPVQADPGYTCSPPSPRPGPARPWEAGIQVSTYSQVNTHNGNLFTAIPIVSWSGLGPDMNMMLYHNSANIGRTTHFAQVQGFNLGPGWSISYSDHLLLDLPNNKVTVVHADGREDLYVGTDFGNYGGEIVWIPPIGVLDELTRDTVNPDIWRVKHKDRSQHEFRVLVTNEPIAWLTAIVDATGNAATVNWFQWTQLPSLELHTRLDYVIAAGRRIDLEYDASGTVLQRVIDPWDGDAGTHERWWTFNYDTVDGHFCNLEDAMDYERPEGYKNYFIFDANGRLSDVSNKKDGTGCIYGGGGARFTYFPNGRVETVTDPGGTGGGLVQSFDYACVVMNIGAAYSTTTYTNRRGLDWKYIYPENSPWWEHANGGTLGCVKDPLLNLSCYSFSTGDWNRLQYYWDASGNDWSAMYDYRGNMLSLLDPKLHEQTWTYDALDNVTSHTDAELNTVRYYYDLPTFPTLLTRIVEPNDSGSPPPGVETGYPVTRLTYYQNTGCVEIGSGVYGPQYACRGQLESVTDPNQVVTRLEYDQWGQDRRYAEGEVPTQTASATPGYVRLERGDSTSIFTASTNNSGNGGSSSHDSNGNTTESGCVAAAAGSGAAASGTWPAIPYACNAPAIPNRSGSMSTATYTPMGDLLSMPIDMEGVGDRNFTRSYDVMRRLISATVSTTEAGGSAVNRTFTHQYDAAAGTYTRTGPDGDALHHIETFVQLDAADRVAYVERRTPAFPGNPALVHMSAAYTYRGNGDVSTITYGNGTRVEYIYDMHRLAAIEHWKNPVTGERVLRLDYEYDARDLPTRIWEYPAGMAWLSALGNTTFTYDRRGRLTHEVRVTYQAQWDPTQNYDLEYQYNAGGNRTLKIDSFNDLQVVYTYDLANPTLYGSKNNRLMKYETQSTAGALPSLLSTTYYDYKYDASDTLGRAGKSDGNPTRIITEIPSGASQQSMMGGGTDQPFESATVGTTVEDTTAETAVAQAPTAIEGAGGGSALMAGNTCPSGWTKYTAIRLGYARNGSAVTFVHDESWCALAGQTCAPATQNQNKYAIAWSREFRYDGARERYMDRKVDAASFKSGTLVELDAVWTDYDRDQPYMDYHLTPGYPATITPLNAHQPGLWRSSSGIPEYLHDDHLGTLRQTSGTTGTAGTLRAFTAFGERIGGPSDRFGYVGAFGYQATLTNSGGAEVFPFLHLGARYYDPASGRFLQRDPIGIRGGVNVYSYVRSRSTRALDPSGLQDGIMYLPMPVIPPQEPSPRDVQKVAQWIGGGCAIGMGLISPVGAGIGAAIGIVLIIEDILEYIGVVPPAPNEWPGAGVGVPPVSGG